MTFLRRRFHDEPEPLAPSPEVPRSAPATPKQIHRRYGNQAVLEAEKTKSAVSVFELEMSALRVPSTDSIFASATDSSPSMCVNVDDDFSPRGPRTERAHQIASSVGADDSTSNRVDDDDLKPGSAPTSPRSGGFIRRLFSGRKGRERALADCAE
jgi:hypothetical protein